MQAHSVECMASGGQAPKFKFFFFAQVADSPPSTGFFLVEFVVNTSSGISQAKVKADNADLVPAFGDLFVSTLRKFGSS